MHWNVSFQCILYIIFKLLAMRNMRKTDLAGWTEVSVNPYVLIGKMLEEAGIKMADVLQWAEGFQEEVKKYVEEFYGEVYSLYLYCLGYDKSSH